MGCNCGNRRSGVVSRSGVSRPVSGAAGSRIAFFAVPPPEETGVEELRFGSIHEARLAVETRPGWRVEARRVPIGDG